MKLSVLATTASIALGFFIGSTASFLYPLIHQTFFSALSESETFVYGGAVGIYLFSITLLFLSIGKKQSIKTIHLKIPLSYSVKRIFSSLGLVLVGFLGTYLSFRYFSNKRQLFWICLSWACC